MSQSALFDFDAVVCSSHKVCGMCRKAHPRSFFPNKGQDTLCYPCRRKYSKQYRKRNKAKIRQYNRERRPDQRAHALPRTYGITLEDYNKIYEAQGGVCAICRRPEVSRGGRKGNSPMSLSVDHHHESGVVRGLLCNKCNHAIGLLREDRTILQAAIEYLDEHAFDF